MSYKIDSRLIEKGDIFIPIKGAKFDGHDFIDEVVSKGGKILDVDLAEFAAKYRQKFNIPIIAITGSSGKTTFKDLLAHILGSRYNVIKNDENQNNEIGVPLTLLKIDAKTDIAIIEMGARKSGDIKYLAEIATPTIAYITNIGYSHIELFGNRQNIAKTKGELFMKGMKVFLNKSIAYFNYLEKLAIEKESEIVYFEENDISRQNLAGIKKIAQQFGISDIDINKSLATFQTSSHRLKTYPSPLKADLIVIDDTYNSNPDGLTYAITTINNSYPDKNKLFILGDMLELGEKAKQLHEMIEINNNVILFTYGNLSRNFTGAKTHKHFNDKERLFAEIISALDKIELIFLKGSRAMNLEEIVTKLID